MAYDCQNTRRPDGINSSIVLLAITAMPQFDDKSLEELRLEDCKAGNKGQNLQTATNQPSATPILTDFSASIGSSMIVEDDKPTSTENNAATSKNVGQGMKSRKRHQKKCPS